MSDHPDEYNQGDRFMSDHPDTDFVETFVAGRGYVQVDRYDWKNYVNDDDAPSGKERAYRERAARAYVELLKQTDAFSRPKPPTWADFEGYARQALNNRDVEAGILLLSWATSQPNVADALAVFTTEALRAHLSHCEGCGEPLITRPSQSQKYHSDACRKRAARK